MFDPNDKKPFHHGVGGLFPPEKPRFTLSEDMLHTMTEMRQTIDRMLKFEHRVECEVHDLMSKLTSDNCLFKDTFASSFTLFKEEVKNEINLFESNLDNTIKLFTDNLKGDYDGLVEEVQGQHAENLEDYKAKLEEAEAEMDARFEAFKTNVENMISNEGHSNADFQRKLTTELNMFEADMNQKFRNFTDTISASNESFKNTWTSAVEERLDAQDTKISNAEIYMKTNLEATVRTELGDMYDSGDFAELLEGEVFADIQDKMSTLETEVNTTMQETANNMEKRVETVEERMDNIVASGTTTEGNAELIDIRVGRDGTSYATAGEAVRTQFENVFSMIKNRNSGTLSFKENVEFDSSAFTVKFPKGYMTYLGSTFYPVNSQTVDLTAVTTSENAWELFYSLENKNIYARHWQYADKTDDVFLGYVYNSHIYLNGVSDKYIKFVNEYDTRRMGFVTISGGVIYDVATKTLTIPNGYIKYDTNGTVNATGKTIGLSEVTTTENAWNIYFNATTGYYATGWQIKVKNNDIFVGSVYNDNVSINGVTADNMIIKKKTVYFFGDSITAGVHASKPYHANMPSLNIKALNYGVGGTGFVQTYTGSGLTGNGCEGCGTTVTHTGNNTIKQVMESAGEFTYASIFAGTNDFGNNVDLETFKTAVEETLDYALTVTPFIVCSTPIRRNISTNTIGKSLEDYAEIIKECCKERAIPCFDAYNDACLDPMVEWNNTQYFSDGLHLNNSGSIRFARFYKEWIQKITG